MKYHVLFAISTFVLCVFLVIGSVSAQDGVPEAFRSTDYPLPRFVSIVSSEVNVRTGPGRQFPLKWVLTRKNMPVEIILEYDVWRKIRDIDGGEGWVHQSLLAGKRSAIVTSSEEGAEGEGGSAVFAKFYKKPDRDSDVLLNVEGGAILNLEECTGSWCYAIVSGYKGWVERKYLWGVYPTEDFS